MKQLYTAIAVCWLALPIGITLAAEHDMSHKGQPQGGMPGMGQPPHQGMHGDMMNPEHLKEKQAHLLQMHELSNKILAEKDPKKQQALKDQQLEVMKAHMKQHMERHQNMGGMMSPPPPPPPENK